MATFPTGYRCLRQQIFSQAPYTLLPLRHHDQHLIRQWRNEQIDILRQSQPLSAAQQSHYYDTVVASLFDQAQPAQLLFAFLHHDELIGYGGLVHIAWADRNAEISFLLATERNHNHTLFAHEWRVYVQLLQQVAFDDLGLHKIYTYAYDIRPHLTNLLPQMGFVQEARLHQHVYIHQQWTDVLIHGLLGGERSI